MPRKSSRHQRAKGVRGKAQRHAAISERLGEIGALVRMPREFASKAVPLIEGAPPDALIVDLGMPERDGLDVIREIRRSPNAAVRDVPAAALTAFARSEDRTKALRSGFELHLSKPVDPGELVASVLTLVRRRRTNR